LEAVLNGMSEGVIVVDTENRVKLINPAAAAMCGVPQDQAAGKLLLELVRQPVMEGLVTGRAERAEIEISGRMLLVHASRLSKQPAGLVLVLLDISELKRLEAVRRDFVANVSHELKTPLSAVVGFTEALQDGAKNDPIQRDDFLGRIHRQSARMAAIVDDLLALTGMETQGIQIERRQVKVRVLIEKALDAISQQARARGIQLAVPPDPAQEQIVSVDEDKLIQALVNLLDNAVKFSPSGGAIGISAAREADGVRISVSDDGPGISAEHLPRLFERFYRVDQSRSRELGGTGLGLAIVKHIVELHGGKVGVDSIVGNGSTFWVLLPCAT
jgi:two-component system phosphate regulon sensor histidine kinase PhoR